MGGTDERGISSLISHDTGTVMISRAENSISCAQGDPDGPQINGSTAASWASHKKDGEDARPRRFEVRSRTDMTVPWRGCLSCKRGVHT